VTACYHRHQFITHEGIITDSHPFIGLFYRTAWVSRHQKGQSNLNFDEVRDWGGSGIS